MEFFHAAGTAAFTGCCQDSEKDWTEGKNWLHTRAIYENIEPTSSGGFLQPVLKGIQAAFHRADDRRRGGEETEEERRSPPENLKTRTPLNPAYLSGTETLCGVGRPR